MYLSLFTIDSRSEATLFSIAKPTPNIMLGKGMHMRDQRFVAVHRGGPLERDKHRLLAAWAAGCAEHVLPLYEACASDDRPRNAIAAARAWAKDAVSVGDARQAAVGAHAAAREVADKAATAAARAAGHAAATVHMADHCLGAALYALKAVEATCARTDVERAWQLEKLPERVCELVISALERRSTTRRAVSSGERKAKR